MAIPKTLKNDINEHNGHGIATEFLQDSRGLLVRRVHGG